MFGKLKNETMLRTDLSQNEKEMPNINPNIDQSSINDHPNDIGNITPDKNPPILINKKFNNSKEQNLTEIEYLNLITDLSEFNGVYNPKDHDIFIICKSNKYYVNDIDLEKIKNSSDFVIKDKLTEILFNNNNNASTLFKKNLIDDSSLLKITKYSENLINKIPFHDINIIDHSSIFNISEIVYCLNNSEPLLFITIKNFDYPIKALIDSGASRSFIGKIILDLRNKLGLIVQKSYGQVQIANSEIQAVTEEIIALIEFNKITNLIKIRVLNSLPVDFIIGLDFLKMQL